MHEAIAILIGNLALGLGETTSIMSPTATQFENRSGAIFSIVSTASTQSGNKGKLRWRREPHFQARKPESDCGAELTIRIKMTKNYANNPDDYAEWRTEKRVVFPID